MELYLKISEHILKSTPQFLPKLFYYKYDFDSLTLNAPFGALRISLLLRRRAAHLILASRALFHSFLSQPLHQFGLYHLISGTTDRLFNMTSYQPIPSSSSQTRLIFKINSFTFFLFSMGSHFLQCRQEIEPFSVQGLSQLRTLSLIQYLCHSTITLMNQDFNCSATQLLFSFPHRIHFPKIPPDASAYPNCTHPSMSCFQSLFLKHFLT